MIYHNNKKIAILLSTYNGEKYLSALLDSIENQTCQDYTLYIRDDGSKDSTLDILKDYASRFCNIEVIDSNKNYGAKYTFLRLLDLVDSEYVMFCDQDDIWMPDKVSHTYHKMVEVEINNPGKPVIVFTDLRMVDNDLSVIAESSWRYHGYNVDLPHTFDYLVHYNDITGCTMMLNKIASNLGKGRLEQPMLNIMYHDWFLALLTAKNDGIVAPLKEQTIVYRRHEGSETDALSFGKSIFHRLNELPSYYRIQRNRYLYFKEWGYGSFAKFLYYRAKLVFKRRHYID